MQESPGEQPKGIDKDDLRAILRSEIESAVDFIEHDIGPDRAESTKYYRGDPLGNEEEGRSQIVTRDVRDAIRQVLPSLIEVFLGSENATEFVPAGPEDVAMAEQATDYVMHVILNDNPGVAVFHGWLKDSLYQKTGIIKWWKDDSVRVTYHNFSGLDDAAVGLITSEPGVEVVEIRSTPDAALAQQAQQAAQQAMMQGLQPPPPPMVHEGRVRRTVKGQRFRIAVVPGEEFLIDRAARDIDSATVCAHRTLMSHTDLVALGYSEDLVKGHVSNSQTLTTTAELNERYANRGGYRPHDTHNKGERKALYTEAYIRVDVDGDGISELRKCCCLGESYEVVNGDGLGEPVEERPFASLCPDPEPHMFFGDDLADMAKDLQRIRTNILRAVLDSLALSIHPRTGVVEGQVNIEDALNTEMGAIIRMSTPGAVMPYMVPFVGKEALSVLAMLKDERDSRIGIHNMAMDADSLQSTTKSAVTAQERAATASLKMIARLYAETGVKRLMKGLLRLVVAHQDQPRMVRLRNKWVQVDPRSWNADMDVSVNVGLGYGMLEDRINSLREVLAFQSQTLQAMGPNNPLVSLGQLSNTVAKFAEISGWKDSSQFVNKLPPDFQMPPPPPPPPTPEQVLAQVEMEKIRADMQVDAAKLDLERDKLFADILIRSAEIDAKYDTAVDVARIKRSIEENRLAREAVPAGAGGR